MYLYLISVFIQIKDVSVMRQSLFDRFMRKVTSQSCGLWPCLATQFGQRCDSLKLPLVPYVMGFFKNACVSSFSPEKSMHGGSVLLFYMFIYWILLSILYHFSAHLTVHVFCSHFTIKCLVSGQKPRYGSETGNTHIYFFALCMLRCTRWRLCLDWAD